MSKLSKEHPWEVVRHNEAKCFHNRDAFFRLTKLFRMSKNFEMPRSLHELSVFVQAT